MRISWRIFCATYVVVFLTVAIVGFALVETNSSYVWDRTKENALTANETAGQLFLLLVNGEDLKQIELTEIENQIATMTLHSKSDSFNICDLQDIMGYGDSFVSKLSAGEQGSDVIAVNGKGYLRVICMVESDEEAYYLQTMWDLSDIYGQRESMIDFYRIAVFAGALFSGAILLLISHFIAVPIKRLSKAVNEIAEGAYDKQIEVKRGTGGIEVAELSDNFNCMAETIHNKVVELNEAVERREQFISDFTHELKTPMTTIIGYADLLRSFELSSGERNQAANTIYREGKRLERLSMQLLELFVMQKDKPILQRVDMKSFFEELSLSLRFLSEKYNVDIDFAAEAIYVMAEPALLHSLFYNIIDNACKASDELQRVEVSAGCEDSKCLVRIRDYGRGIGKEHITQIMEPFYMEDKSRSRNQGGAGLGLALCKVIADIHDSKLNIDSIEGKGTVVSFTLPIALHVEEAE